MSTKVQFTNRSKPAIYITDYEYNYQTPLAMYGRHVINYDAVTWSNLLHKLENWSNSSAPENALEGQLWWDNRNGQLMINIGKDMSTPSWRYVTKNSIDIKSLLSISGGTLYNDLVLIDDIISDDQVVTIEYAATANSITPNALNDNHQYNVLPYSGFMTFNGCIVKADFINNICVIPIKKFTMANNSYSVTVSISTNTSASQLNYDFRYHVVDKTINSFKIITEQTIPDNCEINFVLVGNIQA